MLQKFYFILFLLLNLNPNSADSQNIFDARQSVILQASVFENPPRITLSWVLDTANGGYTIWRKSKSDPYWVDSLVSLSPGSTTWTDSSVATGIGYEYKVLKSLPAYPYGNGIPNFGAGHIYSGIKIPAIHHRGVCLVVIDSTFKHTLAPELARLLADIEADGWQSQALYVDRNDPVPVVKSYIQTWAGLNPETNQVLFLFGRVPVPYSGEIAPDGHHADHRGAWPSDGYYANLDGIWTDQTVNITNSPGIRNDNVPGDGKFDNNVFPSPLKLQVGRVDFANMTKFPESETELLRRYLDKDHFWRIGKTPVMERGLVDNNFGDIEALGQAGWKNFAPMFGISNVKDLPYRQTLTNQSYLWSYGCGGGGPESASDISNTTNFTTDSLKMVFTMLFGSYFGDWDYPNDFLRAAIASRTCLASTWGNRPVWYLHHLAMGAHLGYSAQLTMNNTGLYTPSFYGIFVHTALMGDPTLRMHMLRQVENLSANQEGLHIKLEWQDPVGAQGYFIYKKTESDSFFQLLNQIPVTGLTYLDTCAGQGQLSYMVRSVELRNSSSGTYYNLSTGVTASIQSNPLPFYAEADFTALLYFDALTSLNTSINAQSFLWDYGDGVVASSVEADHLYSQPGNYTVCLVVADACHLDTACQPISILSSLPQVTPVVAPAICHGSATGYIVLITAGGTPGQQFTWSNLIENSNVVENLFAGDYTCTITSETGNTGIYGPFTISEPSAWNLNPVISAADPGQSNGAVITNLQGGCPPFTYSWDTGETTTDIHGLTPGNYCVTISDCKDCAEVFCVSVGLTTRVKEALPGLRSSNLYPNPTDNKLVLDLDFETFQVIQLEIFDALGRNLAFQTCSGKDILYTLELKSIPSGLYWLRVQCDVGYLMFPFSKAGE